MGLETILLVSLVASSATQIAGGFQARDAAREEAGLQEDQARLASFEAEEEADRVSEENRKFGARQRLLFLKAGVDLAGSPLLILEETRVEGEKEVRAIRRRGAAQLGLGMRRAGITRRKGRAALIAGISGGISSATTGYITGRAAGVFGEPASN